MRDLMGELFDHVEEDLDGVTMTPDGLRAIVDGRFGEVTVAVDHDPEAEMLRVSAAVPPPAGSGRSFLLWCLALNARYWDVKVGLDDRGLLLVHSDLDVDDELDIEVVAAQVIERSDTVVDLIDDDLVEWLLEHDLGTPAQRERWEARLDED
ncbi:MAG: hypothetical protein CMN30_00715 [Sandaracinus sp.]|mgnify:CR=1 FL=1|nr:hypothetical protein [Sandaracinus sp.]|tara:strand:+ start:233 stop:688 length:456 start_codon:yes stop_codon:yes gene_type:complete